MRLQIDAQLFCVLIALECSIHVIEQRDYWIAFMLLVSRFKLDYVGIVIIIYIYLGILFVIIKDILLFSRVCVWDIDMQ